jgi:hypothetical protein
MIPLAAGGSDLIACSRGISEIDGDFLKVVIRPWLAQKVELVEGSLVVVDNIDGKFNIRKAVSDDA